MPPRYGHIEAWAPLRRCSLVRTFHAHQGTAPLKPATPPAAIRMRTTPSSHAYQGMATLKVQKLAAPADFHATSRAHQGTATLKQLDCNLPPPHQPFRANQGTATLKGCNAPDMNAQHVFPCPSRHGHIEASSHFLCQSKHGSIEACMHHWHDQKGDRDRFFPCLPRHGHIEARVADEGVVWVAAFRAHQGTATLKRSNGRRTCA